MGSERLVRSLFYHLLRHMDTNLLTTELRSKICENRKSNSKKNFDNSSYFAILKLVCDIAVLFHLRVAIS